MSSTDDIALKLATAFADKNSKLAELQIVFQACPVAAFITNDKGDCLFVNNAYQELVGRNFKDIIGDGWKVIIHPEDIEEVSKFWGRALTNEASFDHQYRYVHPTGRIVPVHCHAVKLPSDGYVGYVNAIDGSNCKFICAMKNGSGRRT